MLYIPIYPVCRLVLYRIISFLVSPLPIYEILLYTPVVNTVYNGPQEDEAGERRGTGDSGEAYPPPGSRIPPKSSRAHVRAVDREFYFFFLIIPYHMTSKNFLLFLVIAIGMILVSGCATTSPPAASVAPPPETTTTLMPTPEPFTGTEYQVRVNYTGSWYGTVFIDGESEWEISGYGIKTFDIPSDDIGDAPWHYIIVEGNKRDRYEKEYMTIDILKYGDVFTTISSLQGRQTVTGFIGMENEPVTVGCYVKMWEPHNENETSMMHLMNAHAKIPAMNVEERALRKALILPAYF